VLVDGVEAGEFPARLPGAADEVFVHELELELAPLARVLRLEPLPGCHARIRKLTLATRPAVPQALQA
jgi:hypothetical protein